MNAAATFPIICRIDSTKQKIVFLLDTLDVETQTINFWKEGEGDTTHPAPLMYYKTSLKLSESDEKDLAEHFAEVFDIRHGLVLRRRLWRESPLHNPINRVPGQAEPTKPIIASEHEMMQLFFEKFSAALTTAIKDAFKK